MTDRETDLRRITSALELAARVFDRFQPGQVVASSKANNDLVTEADLEVDRVLREALSEPGEGWLSEESADDQRRLSCRRVWVVDPLDGTKEFVAGIPEWCISIGLVEDGKAVAGGIANPWTGFSAVGAAGIGCTLNGDPVFPTTVSELDKATVLASRTEVERGQWRQWEGVPFRITPMGSVALKLAQVAVGLADATWTLVPKHEWDVVGGVALVEAAGGWVSTPDGRPLTFNLPRPKLSGLVASGKSLEPDLRCALVGREQLPA